MVGLYIAITLTLLLM